MRCFHARTTAHVLHLKTRSYATHKALNDFYDDIVPLADSFAEVYQGEYGLIETFPARYVPEGDGLTLMENLGGWIAENRHSVCKKEATHLQNIIDEIVALVNETAYKLKFLK